ncbi:hypothetical protein LSUE1_G001173, partial [Lachnellula suecica]
YLTSYYIFVAKTTISRPIFNPDQVKIPSAAHIDSPDASTRGGNTLAQTRCLRPLVNSGLLDKYKHQDLTPFEGLQVSDLLGSEKSLIEALAVTISERGVVFLRDQDASAFQMKELMERITQAAGCPEVSLETKLALLAARNKRKELSDVSRLASAGWHADITFEPLPSDYTMLKIYTLPSTGGNTISDLPPWNI